MALERTLADYASMRAQPLEKCGSCNATICVACGTIAHPHSSCAANKEAVLAQEFVEAAQAKQCPSCGIVILHYRRHGCHHIMPGTGCPNCHYHFCYACLGPHPCRAGCMLFCSDACDCVTCPDCAPGVPCPACDGCQACILPL